MLGDSSGGLFAQQEAQNALAAGIVPIIPSTAQGIVLKVSATAPMSRNRYYVEDGGVSASMRPPRAAQFDTNLISDLRAAMYQEGLGTWFSAVIRVDREGSFDATFNYDDEPEWDAPVDPIVYLTDQETFPRDVENQPQWLQEKIAEGARRRHELGLG
ncbi:hypothetical protein [Tsukamurella paurometabola]|uniref:Uncharacterized protein n=1 Tax=Tsukamurella paurometabola TaxID=2061 RepID=A0ABS5NE52_TSUPA|nr:hypothetical protein [Tsukamurella paurometabola]MBS4102571.1 hypothetical protein [Tsukamurella paurometabola]